MDYMELLIIAGLALVCGILAWGLNYVNRKPQETESDKSRRAATALGVGIAMFLFMIPLSAGELPLLSESNLTIIVTEFLSFPAVGSGLLYIYNKYKPAGAPEITLDQLNSENVQKTIESLTTLKNLILKKELNQAEIQTAINLVQQFSSIVKASEPPPPAPTPVPTPPPA